MADRAHLQVLEKSVDVWNNWRFENPKAIPDLSGVTLNDRALSGADLGKANLKKADLRATRLTDAYLAAANLTGANLSHATLVGANLFHANLSRANLAGANLSYANLLLADLSRAILNEATLDEAKLRNAKLLSAKLTGANLFQADLANADLTGADLTGTTLDEANLVHATLDDATLKNASIFGVSAWDVSKDSLKQENLTITPSWESGIAVDDIEIGQFIYLLLSNERIRDIIDTVTSKSVLILGRFTEERKRVLNSIREAVRDLGYVPILFDFLPSPSRNLTETVQLLANMSKFVIADLTDAKSIPQELSHIIPNLPSVPIQPILHGSQWEYAIFEHWRRFNSVLPEFRYQNELHLIDNLQDKVIKPVQEWEKGEGEILSLQEKIKELEAKLAQKKIE
jgi:uncharacterized protein YjbI with pentapeptide repeats